MTSVPESLDTMWNIGSNDLNKQMCSVFLTPCCNILFKQTCVSQSAGPRPDRDVRGCSSHTKSWRSLLLPVQLFTCPSLFQTCAGSWNILHAVRLFCWIFKGSSPPSCPSGTKQTDADPPYDIYELLSELLARTHTPVTLYKPPTRSLLTHHWSHAAAVLALWKSRQTGGSEPRG